ncbi:MAG: hypothetical protein V3U32_00715 [Anaerolineales bacterium]
MILLLGIDDTDDSSSRGTGYQARQLGKTLHEAGLADFRAVTRHQLLVDSRIDYTNRNSSACLVLEAAKTDITNVLDFARLGLKSDCAPDSNVGITLVERSAVNGGIQDFGRTAKHEVLSVNPARELAERMEIHLEGINGTGAGVIGALAAIGLHASGEDGRFIWLPKLRELDGSYTVAEVIKLLGVDVTTISGEALPPSAEIEALEWMRPIMREGRAILLAERENQDGKFSWRFVDKPTVKALSD